MFDYPMLWNLKEHCSMDVWMMNEYDGDISIYKLEIE